jgi:hypothetical protein
MRQVFSALERSHNFPVRLRFCITHPTIVPPKNPTNAKHNRNRKPFKNDSPFKPRKCAIRLAMPRLHIPSPNIIVGSKCKAPIIHPRTGIRSMGKMINRIPKIAPATCVCRSKDHSSEFFGTCLSSRAENHPSMYIPTPMENSANNANSSHRSKFIAIAITPG